MRLTRLSVFHPVIAITITMTVVIFGVFAFFNLGLEQNPQRTVPIMTITASYPGASAEAVEQDVTRPIEDAVVGVGNVKTMTSTSQTSLATLTVEFQEGVNIDVAASDVQQHVSRILSTLPTEVEEPSYAKLDLNDVPVLNLAVSGPPGGDPPELYRVANDVARPALETSPGVGRVVVVGGQKPEVHVEVQPDRLRAYGLTLNDVTNAVQSQFVNTSAGQATNPDGTQRASVRVISGIADLYALGNVTVSSPDGSVSTELRNVATVSLGGEEAQQLLRVNGQPAAGLLVYKQSNANITQAVDAARPTIEQINSGLPADYRVEIVIDQSTIIRQTVRGVGEELVLAGIIAGLVLFFFLHSLRSTAIVVIAIPVSLLIAMIVMWLSGLSLNNLTLIALTTSIGVLVDDSIVVLENIHTHLEEDEEPKQAAVDGRSEIGMAAIAITLVDVAVWGPILFLTGLVGAFLRNFALVMVAAVLASLLVSFTLTPLAASRWLSRVEGQSLLNRIAAFWEPAYRLLAGGYRRLLHWSLRHRAVVIVATLLAFAANFVIVPRLGTEFVPVANGTTATVIGEMPPGTGLDASNRAAKRWEEVLLDDVYFPEVETTYIQIGSGGGDQDPRLMTVTLGLSATKARVRTSQEIARAAANAGTAVTPQMAARVSTASGQRVQFQIFDNDLTTLTTSAGSAGAAMRAEPKLID